jgi:hypothetical protein
VSDIPINKAVNHTFSSELCPIYLKGKHEEAYYPYGKKKPHPPYNFQKCAIRFNDNMAKKERGDPCGQNTLLNSFQKREIKRI